MDCHYHDDMYVCWTLYRHNVVFLESYSTLTFFIFMVHLCEKTVYIFLLLKHAICWPAHIIWSSWNFAIEFQMNRTIDRLNMKTINTFMRMKNGTNFVATHYGFFSPNLLRFVSMRAWHGLFFLYSFSSLCNSPVWKVKCKHEIIRKVHSWCIRKSIVQFFSLFFRLHCCNQLFNEYNNEHSYHLWMKHTHSRLHEIDNKIENID